ncbi:M13 family metallopeptidase [Thermomonas carbonis]|uniref:M13 family metallopeptidase n=1 Tax=Thermomonas carbonis TaxID=1463158 RepID=A0A7G9SQT4_9GAMM|nr:M13 family metallopeptidase [Thermomonas carbonis]QNN70209.1 M13 family metallopeptidase [Thermomonas carbonis]GHB98495.1 peptidase M13 [Thermomonas carbonis]
MPTTRPLAFALIVALAAGSAAPDSLAAKKPAAKKKAPAVALACSDFHAEANKAWLTANPMPPSGAISALGQLTARAQQQQRELLDAAMQSPQGNVQKLLGDFWASGLDEAAVERDGANPVAPLLQRIDGIRKPKDVAPAIAALHQVGIPALFNFSADLDLRALDRHVGYFSQGGLGLPDPAYYSRSDADTQALIARYADYIRKILTLTGIPAQDLERETALVLDLEKRIAASARPLVELRDPRTNFAPVATAGLGKQYRNLQLDAFLKAQGVNDDTVSMANPAMFAQLDTLVGSLKPAQWKTYLRWRVGDAMAPHLAKPWRDAAFDFRGKILLGQTEPAPRWQQVLDAINLAAGPMLGREYAARYLPDATRQQAMAVASQVRDALQRNVDNSTWLGETAKQEARKKIGKMGIEIGTPKRDLDYTVQPMGRGSFGSNMLIASTWRHREEMKRIGRGNAERRWDVLPQQPALAYDLAHNRLIVTAAMLQAPVFDPAMPLANQYGAFGALVGHELSHAVDGRGRMIDAGGNVRDWWTGAEAAAWDATAQRVIALYDGLTYPQLPAIKVNGRLTRDENVADLAGLELARAAFVTAEPTGGTTADKAFYTGWAQVWAQQVTAEEAQRRSLQDVRAPGQWRTNAPIMQQAAFGSAYGCKVGTPMQPKPEARISVFH